MNMTMNILNINRYHAAAIYLFSALLLLCFQASTVMAKPKAALTDPLGSYRLLALCLPNDTQIVDDKTDDIYPQINWAEFKTRDILLIEIRANSVHTVRGNTVTSPSTGNSATSWYRLEHKNPDALRKQAACTQDFDYILIGKDTGVKKRWDTLPAPDEIFNLIDAMPMRRREMQINTGKN